MARQNDAGTITPESLRRSTITIGLWVFGIFAIFTGIVSAGIQVVVPLFSLENELWNRPDNPHTFARVCFHLALGAVAIFAARSTDRTRFVIGLAVVLAGIVDWLYGFGLFDT